MDKQSLIDALVEEFTNFTIEEGGEARPLTRAEKENNFSDIVNEYLNTATITPSKVQPYFLPVPIILPNMEGSPATFVLNYDPLMLFLSVPLTISCAIPYMLPTDLITHAAVLCPGTVSPVTYAPFAPIIPFMPPIAPASEAELVEMTIETAAENLATSIHDFVSQTKIIITGVSAVGVPIIVTWPIV